MGTGRLSWLVMLGPHRHLRMVVLGPHLLFVVLGPCHHWWVVLVPRHQLRVVLLGPCRFSWVDGLGTGHIVRGWWWCALVSFHAAWPPSPSWWSCHHLRERVVGHSCLQTLHLSLSHIGILHCFRVLLSHVLIVMCPRCCRVSLIVVMCPCCVVVPCPPCRYPVMLLPCPHCDMSFDCHIAVGDMAPVVKR